MGGRNKALLAYPAQTTFIERQIHACEHWTDEIVIVTNDAAALSGVRSEHARLLIVPDRYVHEGPLAGVHAGFAKATRPYIWLLACDQPQASAAAASLLLERLKQQQDANAALPILAGHPQPLHAIYRNGDVAGLAEDMLRQGERRLQALLKRIRWIGIHEDEFEQRGIVAHFADDVDTPEDYERFLRESRRNI